jgi:hypothetical protein
MNDEKVKPKEKKNMKRTPHIFALVRIFSMQAFIPLKYLNHKGKSKEE